MFLQNYYETPVWGGGVSYTELCAVCEMISVVWPLYYVQDYFHHYCMEDHHYRDSSAINEEVSGSDQQELL